MGATSIQRATIPRSNYCCSELREAFKSILWYGSGRGLDGSECEHGSPWSFCQFTLHLPRVSMTSNIASNKPLWKTYQMGLVPGPTLVPTEVAAAYAFNFGATDLEPEYFQHYAQMQTRVQKVLQTKNDIVFMTGEAMVTLWGALKSVLKPGDAVYTIGCGAFVLFAPFCAICC